MEFANYFDTTVCFIILILAFKGIFTGFIREIFSLTGIIGGVWIASKYSPNITIWLSETLKTQKETMLNLIIFMIILASIWILALVIAELIIKFVKFIKLGIADKILGVIFSGIKVFLILSIIFFTFSKINFISTFTEKIESSFLYAKMVKVGNFIVNTKLVKNAKQQAETNISNIVNEINQ